MLALALLPSQLLLAGCSFDTTGIAPEASRDVTLLLLDSQPAPDRTVPGDARALLDRAAPASDGSSCAWRHRRKLTFAASALTEDLSDVPVLVALEGTRLAYAKLRPDGSDLRFTDADGVTVLPHEIEQWNPKGRSFIWVKVPQIDKGSTVDHIWLYYGNASPTPGLAPSGVWSNGYRGVWHLDDDPSAPAPQIKDSSSPGTDLTVQGALPKSALVAGKVGRGLELDGASQSLSGTLGAAPPLFTLEAWIRLDVVNTTERHIVELKGVQFFVESNGKLEAGTGTEFNVNGPTVLQTQQWYHVALVQGASGWTIYLDGKQEASGSQITTPGSELFVGHIYSSGYPNSTFLDGLMDEVRVSGVERSAVWMAAQQRSMGDTLLRYGAEQLTGGRCPP